MKKVVFKNVDDFCNRLSSYPVGTVSVVAYYDCIVGLLNYLVKNYDYEILYCDDLGETMVNGYSREYILTVAPEGKIWVEKCYNEKYEKYIRLSDNTVYIHSDCNSKIYTTSVGYCKEFIEFCYSDEVDSATASSDDCFCEEKEHKEEKKNEETVSPQKHKSKVVEERNENNDVVGFTQYLSVGNANYSRSFYSDQPELVKEVLKNWIK